MRAMASLATSRNLRAAYEDLVGAMRARQRILVAFSGGVDSGLVARIAHDALGVRAIAVLAESESLARWERMEAESEAAEIGIRLRTVRMSELADARYAANPTNRCYFCRTELGSVLAPVAAEFGSPTIADGVNVSDLADVRPGIRAMDEAGFWHPLVEFGLAKPDVRTLARDLGLSFHAKPSNACLSSRVPHGTPITVERLRRVEAAEDAVRALGFRQVRVRHDGETARVEVSPEEVRRLRSVRLQVVAALGRIGYRDVIIDPRGYRSLA